MTDYEKKLKDLFVELPEVPAGNGGVVTSIQSGKLLFVGQQLPYSSAKLAFKGRLGIEIDLDRGRLAARHALLGALSVIQSAIGSLNKVEKIIQLTGYVASGGDFADHDRVLESASQLLVDLFGQNGKHTRVAVGVNQLPKGACVALSMIVQVR